MDGWKHGKYNVILSLDEFYQPAVTNSFIGALLHSIWHLMSLFVTLSELVLLLNATALLSTTSCGRECHRLNHAVQRNTSVWCLLLKYLQIFKLVPSIYITCLLS